MKKLTFPPAAWIASLYFSEGVPAAIICEVSIVVLLLLGWNAEKTTATVNALGLIWIFKPLWSPTIDIFKSKKFWIVAMQFCLAAAFAASAYAAQAERSVLLVAILGIAAFFSATFDIAGDGFYLVSLNGYQQTLFSGLRSVFFRCAMVFANGGIVYLIAISGNGNIACGKAFMVLAALFAVLGIFHLAALPECEKSLSAPEKSSSSFARVFELIKAFVVRKNLWKYLFFILFYRFAEAQLGVIAKIFLLDQRGAAMPLEKYSISVGTIGIAAMLAGGILGGIYASRFGLKKSLLLMTAALNLPDILYLLWGFVPINAFSLQNTVIAVEQFGYGFGFAGYMLLMIYFTKDSGDYKTSHFSLLTGFMILGLRLPGIFSGKLLSELPKIFSSLALSNYQLFFIWVMLATLVSFAATLLVTSEIDPDFGKKESR